VSEVEALLHSAGGAARQAKAAAAGMPAGKEREALEAALRARDEAMAQVGEVLSMARMVQMSMQM
jgi:hypothetical protein